MEKFCDIKSRNELADFLNIPRRKLTYVLYKKKVDSFYSSFQIPKKSGEFRQINASNDDLKSIQKSLAKALQNYQISIWANHNIKPNISHGFEKNKSIITNAKIHRNKRFVLNIDLENFFDSFHFGRVRGFFEKNKNFNLPLEVATIIAQLTCYKGVLPQGAPTSPIITNLMCQILDTRLLAVAKKYKVDYTRYADDLTFSTNNKNFLENKDAFLVDIKKEVEHAGFKLNEEKTRLQFKDSKQTVTGLVVNKKINVDTSYFKTTKAMAHSLYTKGQFTINGTLGTLEQLEGRFSFIQSIDDYNRTLTGGSSSLDSLNRREKEFRKFLIYRYFYKNSKPLIITEGKTDPLYIKAALKNLYQEYPQLVTKKDDDTFEFHFTFLKKTKRIQTLTGIQINGGDSLQNVYRYFLGNKHSDSKFSDYFPYFNKTGTPTHAPVILLFDNELTSKKPLKKFLDGFNIPEKERGLLMQQLFIKLPKTEKLYLLTIPLLEGKKESEIEELFSDNTRLHEINGRKLCLKDKYNDKEFYGKNDFSKYIYSNYKSIDFSNFRPVLNALNTIVTSKNTIN